MAFSYKMPPLFVFIPQVSKWRVLIIVKNKSNSPKATLQTSLHFMLVVLQQHGLSTRVDYD